MSRDVTHFNQLTPAEAERLALLAEECGEVIQIVGKILRHGYDSYHPGGSGPNRHLLETEIGHIDASVRLMAAATDVPPTRISTQRDEKLNRVGRYLHHAKEP